jgi:hypothetical protein
MATVFMDARLLKAALALIQQGEMVEVRYVGFGKWQNAMVLGGDGNAKTLRMGVWCASGEIREGRNRKGEPMPIRFIDCLIPEETQARLEAVAREQGGVVKVAHEPSPKLLEALEFAARAQRQRRRNGQFADGTHGCERAGRL